MNARRAAIVSGALHVAACSGPPEEARHPDVVRSDDMIFCAVDGAVAFEKVCGVERVSRPDGALSLVVRHPEGGFRRFERLQDGRGLAVADGAQQAVTQLEDGKFEVTVGGDRYRFPVTVKSAKTDAE